MAEPDIRVLVGTDGSGQIDGKSGKLIQKELKQIASAITGDKAPRITVAIDVDKTTSDFQKQLNSIVSSIKIKPVKIAVDTSSLGGAGSSLVGIDQSKLTNTQKQKLAEKELLTQEKLRAQHELNNIAIKTAADAAEEKRNKKKVSDIKALVALTERVTSEKLSDKFIRTNQNIDILSATSDTTAMRNEYETLINLRSKLINTDISGFAKDSAEVTAYRNEVKQLEDGLNKLNSTIKITSKDNSVRHNMKQNEISLKNLRLEVSQFEKANDRLNKSQKLSSKKDFLMADVNSAIDNKDFNKDTLAQLRDVFRDLKAEVKGAGLEGQNFTTKLASQMNKLGVYFSAATIMMAAWRQVTNTIKDVIALDKAVTDLQIATGKTRSETKELLNTYSDLGKELGATTLDVANAADSWLRQGYSIQETTMLIKDSMMLSKLGQIDSAESTKALTSAMKGYKLSVEEAEGVVDKFTSVDMMAAISAGYLATAMAETATGARLAGIDIDRLAGYIATVGEVTQDGAESVGNFYKVLFARMGNVKEGRLIDPETSDDLSSVETTLSGLGIKLRDNDKEFRNFGEVLDEVASKWESYGTVSQRSIAVAFSGTRQQEKFLTLMDNYGSAMDYAETAANSAGTALDKYENSYLKSVEASQEKFTAQFEQLSNTIWNSDLFKGTFDTGTGLLGGLTWLVDTLGTIPILATTAAGTLSAMTNKGISNVKYAPPYPMGTAA